MICVRHEHDGHNVSIFSLATRNTQYRSIDLQLNHMIASTLVNNFYCWPELLPIYSKAMFSNVFQRCRKNPIERILLRCVEKLLSK